MERFEEQLNKVKEIRLTASERDVIRGNLLRLIGYQRSSIFSSLIFMRTMPIILVIALILGGGVSIASEQALPGDALYAVKVGVNENIQTFFAFSTAARADLETKLAARRLEEAEKLAAEGKLDAEVLAQIEENFEEHADRVQARIDKFEADEKFNAALEASSNFETSLRAHEDILLKLAATSTGAVSANVNALVGQVRSQISQVAQVKATSEAKVEADLSVEAEAAVEGKLGAAQNKLDEVKSFVERVEADLSAEIKAEVNAKLEAADQAVVEGRAKLEAKAFGEAFLLFQKAMDLAQEVQLMAQAHQSLNLNILLDSNSAVGGTTTGSAGASSESGASSGGTLQGSIEGTVQLQVGI